MKSLLIVLAAGSLSLLSAQSTLTLTKHNLNSSGPGAKGNTSQICVFCHTPHNSALGVLQVLPLWNKAPGSAGAFTMYASGGTIQGTIDPSPTGVSLACFSCHDGTQSVGAVINMPYGVAGTSVTMTAGGGVLATGLMTGINVLGKDLSNDHPVSITYPTVLQDPGMVAKATVLALTGSVKLFGATGLEKVQCASCHDVHNNTNAPFLRVTVANSALCVVCHIK